VIGVPRILLGDYSAQSRAMFLANAYLERSQCLASRQTFICAADRFICSRRLKNGHFLCLSALFYKEITIIQNRYADKKSVCEGKTFAHRPMRICVSLYFLKKSQPKLTAIYSHSPLTFATVRLTSIYYRVSGNQKKCFAPNETIDGRAKKIRSPTCGMV
jgi:hypothetical protein